MARMMLIYAQLLFAWSFSIMSYCVGRTMPLPVGILMTPCANNRD